MGPCLTCRFWFVTDYTARKDEGGEPLDPEPYYGQCRHKSPVVVNRPNGVATEFPRTLHDCGCGDHEEEPADGAD